MERRIIKKGKHYPNNFIFPFMVEFNNEVSITVKYAFMSSCLYDFDDNDEYDKNKLVGISFVVFPRIRTKKWLNNKIDSGNVVLPWFKFLGLVVIKPHHWSSIRICWNTVNKEGKIDVWPYVYDRGMRISGMKKMAMCEIDQKYIFTVNVYKESDRIELFCYDEARTDINSNLYRIKDKGSLFMFLDLYFGGNKAAPHDMEFEFARL